MANGGFADPDDLNWNRAVLRVIENSGTDFVPLRFERWIFRSTSDTYIEKAKALLREERYNPARLQVMEVPKSDLSTRPAVVCNMVDRLIYQALVDDVADSVEGRIRDASDANPYSHRLGADLYEEKMFVDFDQSYGLFLKSLRAVAESGKFEYTVLADVASYFERIYHHNLVNQLSGHGCPRPIVHTLGTLLREWTDGHSYSIPQTMWPSDYLGNIYLHQVDMAMLMEGRKYFRFVDDFRVFAETESDAKRVLLRLSQSLRPLGLGLQGSKTRIVKTSEFLREVVIADDQFQRLKDEVGAEFKFNPYFDEFFDDETVEIDAKIDETALRRLWAEGMAGIPESETVLKYCLSLFSMSHDASVVDDVFGMLSDLPHLSAYFGNYLCNTPYQKPVASRIVKYVQSEQCVYDWQALWLIRYLGNGKLSATGTALLRNIISDRNRHDALRAIAITVLGSKGGHADKVFIRDQYDSENSVLVKRSIIVGLRSMQKAERNHALKYWRLESWDMSVACDLVLKK